MAKIIGYCGKVCSDCPAYIATQTEDLAALETIAAKWRKDYKSFRITAEMVRCKGCFSMKGSCKKAELCRLK